MTITDPVTKELMQVPCGMCIDCRLDKARDWAIRCVHEAQLHEENCWITLTYAPEHLPEGGSLDKRDLTLFLKRLRKSLVISSNFPCYDNAMRIQYYASKAQKYQYRYGKPKPHTIYKEIRFYACGEYGRTGTIRPHYHICCFGHDFVDKYFWKLSKSGKPIYRSPALESIWIQGHSALGDLTMETAGYTARYIMKKHIGPDAEFFYDGLEPEYTVMSRRPGIGRKWIEKYLSDVYPKDYFTIEGQKYRPPRYYDQYLETVNVNMYARTKWARNEAREKEEREKGFIDSKRLYDKNHYRQCVTKKLKRDLENE